MRDAAVTIQPRLQACRIKESVILNIQNILLDIDGLVFISPQPFAQQPSRCERAKPRSHHASSTHDTSSDFNFYFNIYIAALQLCMSIHVP